MCCKEIAIIRDLMGWKILVFSASQSIDLTLHASTCESFKLHTSNIGKDTGTAYRQLSGGAMAGWEEILRVELPSSSVKTSESYTAFKYPT